MYGFDVHINHFHFPIQICMEKFPEQTKAGGIHQQTHLMFSGAFIQPAAVFLPGNITDINAAGSPKFLCQLFQTISAPGNQQQFPALSAQFPGNIPSDAGGGTGNQCGFHRMSVLSLRFFYALLYHDRTRRERLSRLPQRREERSCCPEMLMKQFLRNSGIIPCRMHML